MIEAGETQQRVEQLAASCIERGVNVCLAESCTGGLLAAHCTSLAGSSAWFDRAWLAYSNEAKHEMLGVPVALMVEHGAVSLPVAEHMALACLNRSSASLSLAMTGVAGPAGGSIEKPVGTVCFAVAQGDKGVISVQKLFAGSRHEIRQQAVLQALKILIETLEKIPRGKS